MKKFSAMLAVLSLLIVSAGSIAYANDFSDVESRHINFDAIKYVKDQGIVKGYGDGTYQPDKSINRAEFTKIIVESVFPGEASGTGCFPDVQDQWFANYVCFAKQKGIIGGYPDGTFRPEQTINFVEAAKIIVNAFGYQVGSDKETWYRPFVEELGDKAAIPDSVYSFEKSINRGEMAEFMYRLKLKITKKPTRTFAELNGDDTTRNEATLGFVLRSKEMSNGSEMPKRYTCKDRDILPELEWINPPENTEKFAIVMIDPDANDFVHWIAYNINSTETRTIEGKVPKGAVELINDFKKMGYGGPCPPEKHRYKITLYALRQAIPSLNRKNFFQELPKYVIDEASMEVFFTP